MEIYGIGTDIIEISRIEKAIKQTSLFKRKVYTEKEIEHGFSLSDIEILNDELGKPYVTLYNAIKEKAQGLTIQISISHSREYAVSTVIIYKK